MTLFAGSRVRGLPVHGEFSASSRTSSCVRASQLPLMKRLTRPRGNRRHALLPVVALLAVTSASGAAQGGAVTKPLGVASSARGVRAVPRSARVGALFSGDLEGGHFCTASVVRSGGRDLILTAAHCLSGDGDTDVVFAPGYRNGRAPYGLWRVTRTFVPGTWAIAPTRTVTSPLPSSPRRTGRTLRTPWGPTPWFPGGPPGPALSSSPGIPTCGRRPSAAPTGPPRRAVRSSASTVPASPTGRVGVPGWTRKGRWWACSAGSSRGLDR